MSLMQNTSEINKTDKQVYLITLLRKSTNMPQYIDHMVYVKLQKVGKNLWRA